MKKRLKVKKVDGNSSESGEADQEESDSDLESSDSATIGKTYDRSSSGGNVLADLDLRVGDKWQSVRCELDTGANTSLVGHDWLIKITGEANPVLLPSKYHLQSFGGGNIPVLGEVKLPCRRNGRKYTLALQVVDVKHGPLLSAKVCKILGFVKFCNSVSFVAKQTEQDLLSIHRIKAQEIVDRHKQIFDGIGKFAGVVSLEVDSAVPPSIQPPRRVPIALRGKLKQELQNLERDGVIRKENSHTEWVSNIVLVKRKGHGSDTVRICLDPIPLNKALKRPHFQFTTIDEILPELGKAKVFSTADDRKGFWHVVLDEDSSRLTTFWTPFGRGYVFRSEFLLHQKYSRLSYRRLSRALKA